MLEKVTLLSDILNTYFCELFVIIVEIHWGLVDTKQNESLNHGESILRKCE